MYIKSLLLPAVFAATVLTAATPRPFGCGTREPSAEHVRISQKFADQEEEFAASGNLSIAATINVDVYFHVVASSTAVSDGYVTVRRPGIFMSWTLLTNDHRIRCSLTSYRL
jgi:hypothetical protein